jgi:hypothetical protein
MDRRYMRLRRRSIWARTVINDDESPAIVSFKALCFINILDSIGKYNAMEIYRQLIVATARSG